MAMLEIKDLEVYYGMIQAIKGVSFEVNEGEVIALIGANGAGKTTILHTITGLLEAKKGTVTFDGNQGARPQDRYHGNGTCSGRQAGIFKPYRVPEPENGGLYKKRQDGDRREFKNGL